MSESDTDSSRDVSCLNPMPSTFERLMAPYHCCMLCGEEMSLIRGEECRYFCDINCSHELLGPEMCSRERDYLIAKYWENEAKHFMRSDWVAGAIRNAAAAWSRLEPYDGEGKLVIDLQGAVQAENLDGYNEGDVIDELTEDDYHFLMSPAGRQYFDCPEATAMFRMFWTECQTED